MSGQYVKWGFLQDSHPEIVGLVNGVIENVRTFSEKGEATVENIDPENLSCRAPINCDGIDDLVGEMRQEAGSTEEWMKVEKVEQAIRDIRVYAIKIFGVFGRMKRFQSSEDFYAEFLNLNNQRRGLRPFHKAFFLKWERFLKGFHDCRTFLEAMGRAEFPIDNALITRFIDKCSTFDERKRLYDRAKDLKGLNERGQSFDLRFYNKWLALETDEEPKKAVLSLMIEDGYYPGSWSMQALLVGCNTGERINEVLDLFEMFGREPDNHFLCALGDVELCHFEEWRKVYDHLSETEKWKGSQLLKMIIQKIVREARG